jgi:hypothetical protein
MGLVHLPAFTVEKLGETRVAIYQSLPFFNGNALLSFESSALRFKLFANIVSFERRETRRFKVAGQALDVAFETRSRL